jgi:hypothetical protein
MACFVDNAVYGNISGYKSAACLKINDEHMRDRTSIKVITVAQKISASNKFRCSYQHQRYLGWSDVAKLVYLTRLHDFGLNSLNKD